MPGIADNALVQGGDADRAASPRIGPSRRSSRRSRRSCGPCSARCRRRATSLDARARRAASSRPSSSSRCSAPTFAPTMISASRKRNVIPALCEIVVDCRLLPGQTPAEVERDRPARCSATTSPYDLEFLEAQGGTRSALDTPLWDGGRRRSSRETRARRARACRCCTAGFTDSHWLREAFGTVAYGFFPARAMPAEVAAHAHPLGRRARAGRRPRARGRLAALRGARRLRMTVELDSLAELEPALAADGFFERDDVVAHVYVGYRCSDALRRTRRPRRRSRARCPRSRTRSSRSSRPRRRRASYAIGEWQPTWTRSRVRATRSRRFARRSPRATSTRSTSCSTCARRSTAIRARSPPRSRRLRPLEPDAARRRRLDDRLRVARAPALAARHARSARRRSRARARRACRSSRRRMRPST